MKELSIKEKAKRYDEAVREAYIAYKDEDRHLKATLERIFPELKESEDERMLQEIKRYIKEQGDKPTGLPNGTAAVADMIAWLEKQKEGNFIDKNLVKEEARRIAWEYSKHYDPLLSKECWCEMAALDMASWLEKQGEQKPNDDLTAQEAMDIAVAKCFDEQNPADKVEPKFHKGDWVVQGCNILKIRCVGDEYYCFETVGGYVDDMLVSGMDSLYHLWTIQDAKDGDVLVNWNNTAFIFKAIKDETVKFYIAYNEKWDAAKTPSTKLSHLGLPEPQFEFHPATKEQRDTLFARMKEAGYKWNAEQKKLEKIEQKPYTETLDKDIELYYYTYGNGKGGFDNLSLEKFKDIVKTFVDDYGIQKPFWSEEDEKIFRTLSSALARISSNTRTDSTSINYSFFAEIDWLKSLKDRYTWKPSDEQMNALNDVISSRDIKYDVLSELWTDLKKLKA